MPPLGPVERTALLEAKREADEAASVIASALAAIAQAQLDGTMSQATIDGAQAEVDRGAVIATRANTHFVEAVELELEEDDA